MFQRGQKIDSPRGQRRVTHKGPEPRPGHDSTGVVQYLKGSKVNTEGRRILGPYLRTSQLDSLSEGAIRFLPENKGLLTLENKLVRVHE